MEKLQRDNASSRSGDPVLPILLRRLDGLAQSGADARSARRNFDAAWQRRRSGGRALDDLVLRYATEVVDFERQEQSEVEAVWDLLDIAREVAAGLHRLNREALRRGLRDRGVHVSNRRLGAVLQRLPAESAIG